MFDRNFFSKNTVWVAKNLLGKKLVRIHRGKKIEVTIAETEAYHGHNDKASHASRGKTARTEVMFGNPGTIYVYLIYGMHYCLNFVTGKKNFPAAVLIRGIEVGGEFIKGPGRVSKFLKLDKKINKKKLSKKSGLWVEDGVKINRKKIKSSKRIGIDYAGPLWANKPWRFDIY